MRVAAGLLAVAVAAVLLGAPRLARADWPLRAPALALVLWQALGLTGGLAAVELAATVALAPYGGNHAAAVRALLHEGPVASWWSTLAGLAGLMLLGRLVQALLRAVLATARDRRRLRDAVDLVATRNPLLRGARVLEHDVPVAWCLPGLRQRLVLTQGALRSLTAAELAAVLAHERAHLDQRHDLVVLPFAALGASLPRLPGVAAARDRVALLVELVADDVAARSGDRRALARALAKVGAAPAGTLGAGATEGPGGEVLLRARRLLDPPPRLPGPASALVVLAGVALLAVPPLGLLLPLLR